MNTALLMNTLPLVLVGSPFTGSRQISTLSIATSSIAQPVTAIAPTTLVAFADGVSKDPVGGAVLVVICRTRTATICGAVDASTLFTVSVASKFPPAGSTL